jgi:Ca2+-binding RTX toxin-like protein
MKGRVSVRLGLALSFCIVMLGGASSAMAATAPFGCRASSARVTLGSTNLLEPIVANTNTNPCTTASSGVSVLSVAQTGSPLLNGGPAGAFTYSSANAPSTTGPVAPGASSLASIDGVTIPTSSGPLVIVGPVEAKAAYACVNGHVVASSDSNLDLLYLNGQRITLTPDKPTTIPLGGDNYIKVNNKIQTANSLTERVLEVHLGTLADIVVGEATVTQNVADPCAGTNNNTPPNVNPCPAGSTFVPSAQLCEIILPGGGVIVISRPFEGPTGGSVLSLQAARRRFHSPCLQGAGPQYAVVGTNHADRINGTHRSERILSLAGPDRVAGQGGNDCIDGGSQNDRIWAGNGNERVYGSSGNDRVWGGNGNDMVDGGSGSDRLYLGNGSDHVYGRQGNDLISVGRGNDHVDGGVGNDRISTSDGNTTVIGGAGNDSILVGNGRDHLWGNAGNDRIYAPGERDFVNCGSGRNLAYVNVFAAGYARRHGCGVTRSIRPHRL